MDKARRIDFFIIGAQKSGTTTLVEWLKRCPGVFLPDAKENWYFAHDDYYRQGEGYLSAVNRRYAGEALVGSSYAHSMYLPQVAGRVHEHNPEARIIAILRNPVDRAYSAYWFARRNGWESASSFEEALNLEPGRMRGTYKERTELTYVDHGRYARQLEPYFALFGRERVRVILSDDLVARPEEVAASTLAFLGCKPVGGESVSIDMKANAAALPRSLTLQRIVMDRESWLNRSARALLAPERRMRIRALLLPVFERMNTRRFDYPPMAEDTRQQLVDGYREDNLRLEALLQSPVRW